jgi:RNA polymerase sigma-54 factor
MALKQSLQQRLLQKLSPQQIQLMKMLQLPTVELEKRIKEELEINPALDEGEEQTSATNTDLEENTENKRDEFNFDDYTNDETPYYKTQSNNYSKELEEQQKPLSFGDSLSERLTKQIRLKIKDDDTKKIAEHIIGNLDESGYLRRELFNIVDDLAFSQNIFTSEENLEKILIEVQALNLFLISSLNNEPSV